MLSSSKANAGIVFTPEMKAVSEMFDIFKFKPDKQENQGKSLQKVLSDFKYNEQKTRNKRDPSIKKKF